MDCVSSNVSLTSNGDTYNERKPATRSQSAFHSMFRSKSATRGRCSLTKGSTSSALLAILTTRTSRLDSSNCAMLSRTNGESLAIKTAIRDTSFKSIYAGRRRWAGTKYKKGSILGKNTEGTGKISKKQVSNRVFKTATRWDSGDPHSVFDHWTAGSLKRSCPQSGGRDGRTSYPVR